LRGGPGANSGTRLFDYNRTSLPTQTLMNNEQKPLVLVVDDYQDAREMYAEYLSFSGFRVIEASTGNEAVEKAFDLRPDVILMDLSLPGMDGWAATRKLKNDERTRRIPVVALTGHALAGASEGARLAGCDAFVTKPCLPDELVLEVRRVLGDGNGTAAGITGH
jgi:two-component system cell cycle response regulator DivK